MGAELFHVDRQTDRDMTELIGAIRNFAKTPKNLLRVSKHQIRKVGPEKTRHKCLYFTCCSSLVSEENASRAATYFPS